MRGSPLAGVGVHIVLVQRRLPGFLLLDGSSGLQLPNLLGTRQTTTSSMEPVELVGHVLLVGLDWWRLVHARCVVQVQLALFPSYADVW